MSRPTDTTIAPKVSGYLARGAGRRQRAGQGRPGPRPHRRSRLSGGARTGQGRCRRRAGGDRQQRGGDRRAAIGDRFGQGDDPGRSGQRNFRRAGKQALRRSRHDRLWLGAERTAGDVSRIAAARASVQRDNAALASAVKQVALQKAELAQAQAVLAHDEAVRRQAELNLGYATIVAPGRRHRRQPHARASANMSRPARS